MPTKHYYDQIKKLGRIGTDLASAYAMGYNDAFQEAKQTGEQTYPVFTAPIKKSKRKLNSWQKFVKANSNKRKFRFKDGKLKLKSMGIAYRKTAAYKRSKK